MSQILNLSSGPHIRDRRSTALIMYIVVLTLLPELLRGLSDYRMLIYAVVLILMMLFTSAPAFVAYREKLLAGFRKDKAADGPKAKEV